MLLPWLAQAHTLHGRVVAVADGDTITVIDDQHHQYRIRLAGIDAPEKGQPFGARSRQHLVDMIFEQMVDVEWRKRDRYGRIVGKVSLDRRDADLAQVEAGLAWHYKQYQREQTARDREVYAAAEGAAQAAHQGLWADPTPVPPWDWRRNGKKLAQSNRARLRPNPLGRSEDPEQDTGANLR